MALWLEEGAEPVTENERADLDAITALKESTFIEFKEKGNQFVKMGRKYYNDAIDCYTRAINQKVLSESENSVLFSNRAHVNLLLGNYRRALSDAEEAIKLSPTNLKAFYRASKAALSLDLLNEASTFCQRGLERFPSNEELKKLATQIGSKRSEIEQREAQVSMAIAAAKDLVFAVESRGLKLGKAMYQELTGVRKPVIDKSNIFHWPVLLLYAEVMSSDFIEDFCEIDTFSSHLDMISLHSACPPLSWDVPHAYTRDAVELYYEAGVGAILSKGEAMRYFLHGTAGSHAADSICDEEQNLDHQEFSSGKKWVKVNEKKTLYDILRQPDYVIPGIPVFFIVSKQSPFYKEFKAGKWNLP
ncbi:hypothetical protein H6P81_012925 [Aristolochia fimbriata]|uniref:Cns1/TTC4 wheel domain-containing protein n=1 Tax=Aristolochia fimbriata TaxID=158543 RepID=A0AAV7ED82_ARIFI|nr:hypothetical protein H6P81_012925 [Aristolochia fimbriata]